MRSGPAIATTVALVLLSGATSSCHAPSETGSTSALTSPSDPLAQVELHALAGRWAEATRALEQLDVGAVVTASEIRGDHRYLVGSTFYLSLPGVPNQESLWSRPETWRELPGITDAAESDAQSRYNGVVRTFAEKYNMVLYSRTQTSEGPPNNTMNPTAGGRRPPTPARAFARRGLW
jgi:hypothetical protein